MRSTTLWALAQADRKPVAHLLGAADAAGYDLALHEEWLKARQHMARSRLPASGEHYDVVIVGGGAGGIASAASILRRDRSLSIAIIRSEEHTSELQSLMRISYAVFCLKKQNKNTKPTRNI